MINNTYSFTILRTVFEIFNEVDMWKGLGETIYMIFCSTIISYLLGLPIGIFAVLTDNDGVLKNTIIHKILNAIINIGRSIPFIILIVVLIPFTRFLVGKSWGATATIVSLSVAATFFVARITEQSLKEVDQNVIESALCMGTPIRKLIFQVYLREASPSLIRGIALTLINLVGYSAMAGAVGGGGLGDIAIRYGYYKFDTGVMLITLVVIVLLVQLIQLGFDFFAKRIDKSRKILN